MAPIRRIQGPGPGDSGRISVRLVDPGSDGIGCSPGPARALPWYTPSSPLLFQGPLWARSRAQEAAGAEEGKGWQLVSERRSWGFIVAGRTSCSESEEPSS
eukprot:748501-Hanusia_phi.AAC.4